MMPFTRQPGSKPTTGATTVLPPGRYGFMSAVEGAPPGVGFHLSVGTPRDSRTEYSGPLRNVVTGKQGLPSRLAARQGLARSASIRSTTRSTESLTGRDDAGD